MASNTNFYVTEVQCELNGETYGYEIVFDDNYQIHEEGGDAFISNHIDTLGINDVNELTAHIEDYFSEHGGTCTITKDRVPYEEP